MKKLKNTLKKIPILNKALRHVYQKINPNKNTTNYWLQKICANRPIQVLQIGSNDGISGDPLNQLIKENPQWQVLFVEPIPDLFEQLKRQYGANKRFKFENAGINEDGHQQKFYQIADAAFQEIPDLSEDYKQIGSFSRAQVEKLSTPALQKFIQALDVNCRTLENLLTTHKIETIDLLHIDAEGYDWKILSQLNLEKYQPAIILFEHLNLEERERKEAHTFLMEHYFIFAMRIDYLCIRKDTVDVGDFRGVGLIMVE